jgi:hypothetical protein
MIYIIGCGGVGSWLAPAIAMLTGPKEITLIDGDVLEPKNLNRQLFDSRSIGANKADALAQKYGCHSMPKWYSNTSFEHSRRDWLLVSVDNHAARRDALSACDMSGCSAIIGANETHSSEAYVYLSEWRGTAIDPRHYYPEIETDQSDDPRRAAIGCTGEVQQRNPQLATANMMAAAMMAHLFVLWSKEVEAFDEDVFQFLPYKLVNNLTRNETHLIKDAKLKKEHNE